MDLANPGAYVIACTCSLTAYAPCVWQEKCAVRTKMVNLEFTVVCNVVVNPCQSSTAKLMQQAHAGQLPNLQPAALKRATKSCFWI